MHIYTYILRFFFFLRIRRYRNKFALSPFRAPSVTLWYCRSILGGCASSRKEKNIARFKKTGQSLERLQHRNPNTEIISENTIWPKYWNCDFVVYIYIYPDTLVSTTIYLFVYLNTARVSKWIDINISMRIVFGGNSSSSELYIFVENCISEYCSALYYNFPGNWFSFRISGLRFVGTTHVRRILQVDHSRVLDRERSRFVLLALVVDSYIVFRVAISVAIGKHARFIETLCENRIAYCVCTGFTCALTHALRHFRKLLIRELTTCRPDVIEGALVLAAAKTG